MIIYGICLVTGLVFTLISVMFGHFFGHSGHVAGSGGNVEAGADSSDAPGISIFSPTIIASFITAFGGFGLIFTQFHQNQSGGHQRAAFTAWRSRGGGRDVCVSQHGVSPYAKLQRIPRGPARWRGGQRHHPHPGEWRGGNRLCGGRNALHRTGARGKRRSRWPTAGRSKSPASSEPSFTSKPPTDLTFNHSTLNT